MGATGRRVLIVGDRRRPGVADAVARHRSRLESMLEIAGVDLDESADLTTARVDLILVFGGDGSILHVARRLGSNPIPVLGVNYGRFGFLADLAPEELEEGISRWLAGDFELHQRARLSVSLIEASGFRRDWLALNDVVVGRSDIGRMVDVNVEIGGRPAIRFSGDGLILATPTGSSAHAMASGGPLVEPTLEAIVMVPIAPHSLATRPLVLSSDHRIVLSAERSRAPAVFTVDGAPALPLGPDASLSVEAALAPLSLVRVGGGPFFEALRRKLGWRGRAYALDRDPDSPSEGAVGRGVGPPRGDRD